MIEIKQKKNRTYSIKGLNAYEMEALITLVTHTRLGEGIYENAAFDLCNAFHRMEGSGLNIDDCCLSISNEDIAPIINLSHFND